MPSSSSPPIERRTGWRDERPDGVNAVNSDFDDETTPENRRERRIGVLEGQLRDGRETEARSRPGKAMKGAEGYQRRPVREEASELEFLAETLPGISDLFGREGEAREALRGIDSLSYRRYNDPRMPVSRSSDVPHSWLEEGFLAGSHPEDETALLPAVQALQATRRSTMARGFNVIALAPDVARGPLEATFNAFLASHECYRLVRHGVRDEVAGGTTAVLEALRRTDDESIKRLAPLMAWLASPQMGASVRAEAMAHLQMYVKSGWASRDLGDEPTDSPVVVNLRRLAADLVAGREVSTAELTETIQARFDAVFLRARVCYSKKDRRGYTLEELPEGNRRFSMTNGTVQGSGVPDVLVRSEVNPSDLMLASVTAEKGVQDQRDQLMRHANAVIAAARAGTPPCRPGDRLAEIQFFSLALMPEQGISALRRDMRAAFTFSGQAWDDRANPDFFNLLPLFSMLGTDVHGGLLDPGVVLRTRHLRFGAGNTPFDAAAREEDQAVEAARFLVEGTLKLAQAMPFLRLGHPVGNGPSLRTDMRQTFEMLKDSLQGMLAHYGSLDPDDTTQSPERRAMSQKVHAELVRAVPSLVLIAEHAQVQADSVGFATDLLSLATQLDGKPRPTRLYTLPDEMRVRAVSPARAEALATHERGILARQEKALAVRDERLSSVETAKTESAYRAVGNSLVRMASRLDDARFDRLLAHGPAIFNRIHSYGFLAEDDTLGRTLDDVRHAADADHLLDTWDAQEKHQQLNPEATARAKGMFRKRSVG